MTTHADRYALPHRPWRGPVALSVAAHALVEHGSWRRRRYTLWSQVRGVRWGARGSAEIVRTGAPPLVLPADTPRLAELVAAVERWATERQADWQAHGIPERQVCAWLDIALDGRWRSPRDQSLVRLGLVLLAAVAALRLWSPGAPLVAGLLLLAGALGFVRNRCLFELLLLVPALVLALGLEQHAPLAATLALLLLGVGLTVRGLLSPDGSELLATGLELSGGTHDQRWTIPWRELRACVVTDEGLRQHVELRSDHGSHTFTGAKARLTRLLATVERVVEANTVHFEAAGRPVPRTALSAARMENSENDRSVSLAEPRGD